MKTKFAIAAAVLACGGLAIAQPKTPAGGSGSAAKPAAGSAAIKPAEPPKMEMPKPPAEVAAMAKAMAGTWKCTGKVAMDPANPANMTDTKGTWKATLDLDKYWIKGEWTSTAGKMKARGIVYMTYDTNAKKWYRHAMDTMGMGAMEWSTGLPAGAAEGKMVWEGDHHMMGMMMKGRTTEEVAAKSVTMTGEMSADGGKKWVTGMTMTCKK